MNKLYENSSCTHSYQCLEPMICTHYNICQCGAFEYHDLSTLQCLPQQSFNGNCSTDFNCRVDQYLRCTNAHCQCISAYPLWSNGYNKCIVPITYNQYCYGTSDCNSVLGLTCHDGTQNCVCPTNVSNNYCDCIRIQNNETYWNGEKCTLALSYNELCSNATSSYMCKTLTEGTTCSGPVSFKCKCVALQYYNFGIKQCSPQLSFRNSCSQVDACRSDLGLSCQNGFCECNVSTQFWNTSACSNYFTYNGGICTSDSQCNQQFTQLVCKMITTFSCSCPTVVSTGYCDCPSRTINNELYWNGSQCVSAGIYGTSCNNSYECQILTHALICDIASRICICSIGYWDTSNSACATTTTTTTSTTTTTTTSTTTTTTSTTTTTTTTKTTTTTTTTATYSYNGGTCTNDIQCNNAHTNLICKSAASGSSCACPNLVNNGFCDCP